MKEQQATAAQMHLGREANGDKSTGRQPLWGWKGVGFDRARGRATRQKKAQKWGSYPQGDFIFEENKHKKILFKNVLCKI